jgi:hypothetical protein
LPSLLQYRWNPYLVPNSLHAPHPASYGTSSWKGNPSLAWIPSPLHHCGFHFALDFPLCGEDGLARMRRGIFKGRKYLTTENITAVVLRWMGTFSDCIEIYTTTANYVGQRSSGAEDAQAELSTPPLFLFSKLISRFTLCGSYRYYRCKKENENDLTLIDKKRVIPISLLLSCCMSILLIFCVKFNIKFYEPGQRKKNAPVLWRKNDSLEVAQGFPLFEAVCIVYCLRL